MENAIDGDNKRVESNLRPAAELTHTGDSNTIPQFHPRSRSPVPHPERYAQNRQRMIDLSRNPWRPLAWILGLHFILVAVAVTFWLLEPRLKGQSPLVFLSSPTEPQSRIPMLPIWLVTISLMYLGFSDRAGWGIAIVSTLVFVAYGLFVILTSTAFLGG